MSPACLSRSSNATPSSPFLLRLFFRRNSFYHIRDFRRGVSRLPRHLTTHVSMNTTLEELAIELASISALPRPSIGTRVAFQLLYHDFDPKRKSRRACKATELGSVIIGAGGLGVVLPQEDAHTAMQNAARTLEECGLYIGDYINCLILPPLPDGSAAPLPDLQHTSHEDRPPEPNRHTGSPDYFREKSLSRTSVSKKRRERRRRAARVPEGSWKEEVPRRLHDRVGGRAPKTDRYPNTRVEIDRYPAIKVDQHRPHEVDRYPK